MRISVISFTERGWDLSKVLAGQLEGMDVRLNTRCSRIRDEEEVPFLEEDLTYWAGRQMQERNALIFIGACGIAVRAIAPHMTDKLHDSPVLVMDEEGRYVIPILSGHVGGANTLAAVIAEKINALPIITTATDIRNVFAADTFAVKNRLFIKNREGIGKVSSKILSGEKITISVESGHLGSLKQTGLTEEPAGLPEGIILTEYPPVRKVDIVVTSEEKVWDASLVLRPREYVIGMGCRKGKEAGKIETFIRQSLEKSGILTEQVNALASVDLKSREEGFLSWSRKERIPFITYTPEELKEIVEPVQPSAFVRQVTGVDNVCERAALKAAGPGGKLISEKHAKDGMTIAIAKRKWSVSFDEA